MENIWKEIWAEIGDFQAIQEHKDIFKEIEKFSFTLGNVNSCQI